VDVEQHETAIGEVHRFRQREFFRRLSQGDHLGLRRRRGRGRHLVPASGIRINRVYPTLAADHASQGDGNVASSCTHVRTLPAASQAQAVEGGDEGPTVDIVAQFEIQHAGDDRSCVARPGGVSSWSDGNG
jgi:hypothetical protein